MAKKVKQSKLEWFKKNIVIVPVIAAILAGTFTSIRYVLSLTDTIEANKSTLTEMHRDIKDLKEKVLCSHCGRTSSNGIRCPGICVADSDY